MNREASASMIALTGGGRGEMETNGTITAKQQGRGDIASL